MTGGRVNGGKVAGGSLMATSSTSCENAYEEDGMHTAI